MNPARLTPHAAAIVSLVLLLPGSAFAQAPVVTTEILSGYLLPESNYLVTNRPVIQTDIFALSASGIFGDLWYSHQLYQPTKFFAAPGDEVDLTGGWIGGFGPYLLKAQAAWWQIAGSGNNFADAKVTLSRNLGDWTPFAGIEDQLIIPRKKHIAMMHAGTDVAFKLFALPFQERLSVSWFDAGRVTVANVIYTTVDLGGVVARPILRLSTDDRQHGAYATFGLRFVL